MKNWEQYYTLPFSNDENCEIYVRDKFNRVVFNKLERNPELFDQIIKKLNGESDQSFKENVELDGCYIKLDNRRVMLIRGWGRLTGSGGFSLSSQDACNIQDEFGKWVVEQLKK